MTAQDKVRRPIGAKIFGITVLLLLLMASVTYTSTTKLEQLSVQLDILAAQDIPLDQAVGDIRSNHLSQILWFERLLALKPAQPFEELRAAAKPFAGTLAADCDSQKLREASAELRKTVPAGPGRSAAQYELTRICGDSQLAEAQKLVQDAQRLPDVADDPAQVRKFTQLQEKLADIAPARTELDTAISRYMAETQGKADQRALELLKEQIDQNRRAVSRETSDLARLLHDSTLAAAQNARDVEQRAFIFNWVVTLAAAALGLLCAVLLTRNLVRPVHALLRGARAIEVGDLDYKVEVKSSDEIALLANSFNYMVSGLREKETIKATFGKYVDPRVVSGLLEKQQDFAQDGERREMSVFFSDIEGFTGICEHLTPEAVVRLLNHYFSTMSQPINANRGIIDKFIGDAIMAFWGPPFVDETEHARLACVSALEQLARLDRFRTTLPDVTGLRKGLPGFNMRIGISTGPVTVGSIGSETTKSYTVIGDTANLASRLESINRAYGTRIMISRRTRELAGDAIETRELDRFRVKGKSEDEVVFELLGLQGEVEAAVLRARDAYETGLRAYGASDWAGARKHFTECLALRPDDGPARLLLARVETLEKDPPPADWGGVYTFKEK